MNSVTVSLLDKNGDVRYGLNWGQRDNRDPNESYIQLTPDIYKGDFFPPKGKFFIVDTDDNQTIILTRAQKDYGCALQSPDNNAILGEYLRHRLGIEKDGAIVKTDILSYGRDFITFYKRDEMHYLLDFSNKSINNNIDQHYTPYLPAMRTKPFLLLGGISGTGKSRIVKEMAFASCPEPLRDERQVSPGNYCMVEVKPNWHDSAELIGYVSSIPTPHYVVTPFINFLIKAKHYPNVPFFVCLDEMNLAPVEQYFAEFLSVLESRKLDKGEIVSEPLIKADVFSKYYDDFKSAYFRGNLSTGGLIPEEYAQLWKDLGDNGLRLPPNLIVVGTVNMDETTYQFSRKVIDRAMTIEMNDADFNSMFDDDTDKLAYQDPQVGAAYFLPKYASAKEALAALSDDDRQYLKASLPAILNEINSKLATTPFRIAYRVENELVLYFVAMREQDADTPAATLLATAVDDILMMKVLPRIEGNEDILTDPLESLAEYTRDTYPRAHAKIGEMQRRLQANHFTSFWP